MTDIVNFKRTRFPINMILVCIRWHSAYPRSYRHLEEIKEERCVLDHSSINRWAILFLPLIKDGVETEALCRLQLAQA